MKRSTVSFPIGRQLLVPAWFWGLIGAMAVVIALTANEWVLAALFSADGELAPRNRWIVRGGQCVIGLAGIVLLVARQRIRIPTFGVVVLGVAVAVSPVIAEGALRALFAARNLVSPPARHLEARLGWRTRAHQRVETYRPGYGLVSYHTQAHGFRVFGDPHRDGFRVLVLGDSTTQASQVSTGEAYFEVMMTLCPELELWAYGAGGYGSLQEYMILDAFIDEIDPQLIVWQFDGNDLINNYFEWESISSSDNNLMTRPYLILGQVEFRFPVQSNQPAVVRAIQSSHLMRLLRVTSRRFVVVDEPEIRPGHPVFEGSVETTRNIMEAVRDRAAGRPLVAFCIHPGPDQANGREYEAICRSLGFHYIPGLWAPVVAAKSAGEVVTGVVDGRQIDPHFNALGHRILGEELLRRLVHMKLVPCKSPELLR